MDFTKTIIPLALMASESIVHEADLEPIRARGIIVEYLTDKIFRLWKQITYAASKKSYFVQVSHLWHKAYFYIYRDGTSLKRILSYLSLVCYTAVSSVVMQEGSINTKKAAV